jgi:aminopeptidase C
MTAELTPNTVATWTNEFNATCELRALQNAVCRVGIASVAMSRTALVADAPFCFSVAVDRDQSWSVTN